MYNILGGFPDSSLHVHSLYLLESIISKHTTWEVKTGKVCEGSEFQNPLPSFRDMAKKRRQRYYLQDQITPANDVELNIPSDCFWRVKHVVWVVRREWGCSQLPSLSCTVLPQYHSKLEAPKSLAQRASYNNPGNSSDEVIHSSYSAGAQLGFSWSHFLQ